MTTADSPPPPPAAPMDVAAANGGNGSALVTWSAGGGNAASFEVRRETWNSRKETWERSTVTATVPSGVTSIVDATNDGTFRYFVRALNAGGASVSAGPAPVTVTGGTTRSKGRR